MELMPSKRMPEKYVVYILASALVLFAFIMMFLYPNRTMLINLDREMNGIKMGLNDKKVLFPFYQQLLNDMENEITRVLPATEPDKLPKNMVDRIPEILGDIAKKSKLKVGHITPNLKHLSRSSGLLMVSVMFKGNFMQFRAFLVELGKLPYIEHIEKVKMQDTSSGKELIMSFWIALE